MALAPCRPLLLLVAWLRCAAANVEPPTNVTLHCHNLHNVLEWSYDQLSPGLRFRVNIGALSNSLNPVWVDAPTLQANVSFLSDITDAYHLTVTAVIGQNESEPAPPEGIIFSYFKDSPAKKKCFVDFPSVQVTVPEDDVVSFSFKHPSLLYEQRLPGSSNPRRKQSHHAQAIKQLPVFTYDVVLINQEQHHTFDCVESVCEEELPVDPAQRKHCLKVTGELLKMSVLSTQDYCAPVSQANNYAYIYIIAGILALIAVVFILFMVYRRMTRPSNSFPRSMSFKSGLKRFTLRPVQESVAVPEVQTTSPLPLLPAEESNPDVKFITELEHRLPNRGLSTEDTDACDDEEGETSEGREYMPGSNLDEDETPYFSKTPSGYEKRDLLVKLAPDEQANGYRA